MISRGLRWSLVGFGGGVAGPDPNKKDFNRLLIHISNIDG